MKKLCNRFMILSCLILAFGAWGCGGGSQPAPATVNTTATPTANVTTSTTVAVATTTTVVIPPAPIVATNSTPPGLDGEAGTGSGTCPMCGHACIGTAACSVCARSTNTPTGVTVTIDGATSSGTSPTTTTAIAPIDDALPPVEPPDAVKDKLINHKIARDQINLGSELVRLGKFKEAEASYREAMKNEPNSVNANLGLAHALMAQGKVEDARKEYEKVKTLAKDRADKVWTHWEKKHNRKYR